MGDPAPLTPRQLADAYLDFERSGRLAYHLGLLIREEPGDAWAVLKRILAACPTPEIRTECVRSPLTDFIRLHHPAWMPRIQADLAALPFLREALAEFVVWAHRLPPSHRFPDEVIERLESPPSGRPDPLPPEAPGLDAVAEAWIRNAGGLWAAGALSDLARLRPEQAWEVIRLMLADADEDLLPEIAAGPLHDLLTRQGAAVIGLLEKARDDEGLQAALGELWQGEMPEAVWERVVALRDGA